MSKIKMFLEMYPYMGTAMLMSISCLISILLFRKHRQALILSSFIALPWGSWGFALVPEYWTPRLWISLGRVGIEDFLWAFATGGLAWLSAVILSGKTVILHPQIASSVVRFLFINCFGLTVFMPLFLSGTRGMVAFAISVVGLGTYLLARRLELWPLVVAGGLGFGLINFLVTKVAVVFCSDYFLQMTPGALCGVRFIGLPIEECYWAFATGATWPLVVCYVFGAQFPTKSLSIE